MFEVMVEDSFDAAHCLRGYEGLCENLHGHTYRVQCVLRLSELDQRGIALDFREIKQALQQAVSELDHTYLNELPRFQVDNPTAENLAKYIFELMKDKLGAPLTKVTVWETPTSAASYYEEG